METVNVLEQEVREAINGDDLPKTHRKISFNLLIGNITREQYDYLHKLCEQALRELPENN